MNGRAADTAQGGWQLQGRKLGGGDGVVTCLQVLMNTMTLHCEAARSRSHQEDDMSAAISHCRG